MPLRLQNLPPRQCSLQGRLHLHVAQLGDGEVQVLKGLGALVGIVVQHQLGQLEAGDRDLGTVADLGQYL